MESRAGRVTASARANRSLLSDWKEQEMAAANPKRQGPIARNCQHCGAEFTTWPSNIERGFGKYCSGRCSRACQQVAPRPPRSLIPHPTDSGALLVPLTQGKFAVIDASDRELVESRSWSARRKGNAWYAQSSAWSDGRRTIEEMHILLLGRIQGLVIDHIDGDGLNNRRSNLRHVTHQENLRNQHAHRDNSSGYKGVHAHPSSGLWAARIKFDGQSVHLGYFRDAAEAAAVYDAAARDQFGECARLNFPKAGEQPAFNKNGAHK